MHQSTTDERPARAGSVASRRSRLFAFGLLAYLVLAAATFRVVQRYAVHVAALYDYDIENVALQFGLYFSLLAGVTLAAAVALRARFIGLTAENRLRLAFLVGASFSVVVAVYQSRFGPEKLVNYLLVGTLGAFAMALAVTQRQYRLVEVIARPPDWMVAEVAVAHQGIALAAGLWDRAKRALELVIAVAVMVISLPISVPLAIAVWLQDPGPLLVAKVAVKRAGVSFHQLKLRTMIKDAEGATGPVPASPDDVRVTRLGSLLRRTHIDELPQMINIARGDMSFVGPRPERTVFVFRHLQHVPGYALRHSVRPGLAGMAQVYGDYYSTPKQKLRYDLLYIRRRGPALDLKLFSAAVLIALLSYRPRRRQQRHRRDERRRWRAAYAALRGEPVPDADGTAVDAAAVDAAARLLEDHVDSPIARAHVTVRGIVQGVYFRATTAERGRSLGVTGWVRNLPDGSVEAVAEGPREAVERFVEWCGDGPPTARVTAVATEWSEASGDYDSFLVVR